MKFATMLDPMILKALPAVIPPFPPGMLVTLSDGTDAVVTAVKPERPYHPQVRRIEDPDTLKLASGTLDMALQTGLKIDKVAGQPVGDMVAELPNANAVRAA